MILTKKNIKSADLRKLVDEKIERGETGKLLIIVPTNRKLRNLKKEIISASPNKSVTSVNLETITTLSIKLLERQLNFTQLSEAAATVLIKQSTEELNLKYFTNYKGKIPYGTLDRVKNVISEYKKHGVLPDTLRDQAGKLEKSEKLKAIDISDIYEKYLNKCSRLKAMEIGDVYKELVRLNRDNFTSAFSILYPNVNLIVVNGFDEFTNLEVEIIDRLSGQPNVDLFLFFDYFGANPLVFSHLDKCYNNLAEKGFRKISGGDNQPGSQFISIIREKLFANNGKVKKYDYTKSISEIYASNRENEIALIAKEIKALILQKNVEPHKICISFNLIQKYSPIIRDVFSVYAVPFNLTDRISLNNSYPVIAILNMLEIIEKDFYYKNIFRAFSSGYVDPGEIDLSNLFKTAAKLKIVVGRENWISSIREKINRLKQSDDINNINAERQIADYSKALNDIDSITKLLSPFSNKLTIQEFLNSIKKLCADINLPALLLKYSSGREEEHIKSVAAFFDALTEILSLIEEENGKKTKYKIEFFTEHIRTFTNWARFNIKEKSNYGVQVTTINEIRGLDFDYLFIAGLCDGDFPTRYAPEIFFSGSFLKKEDIHQNEERYHFYQSLCSWKKGLYLTHPAYEGEKELVESSFINDFKDIFKISFKNESNFDETLYSKYDLLIEAGQHGIDILLNNYNDVLSSTKNEWESLKNSIEIDNLRTKDYLKPSPFTGYLKCGKTGLNIQSVQWLEDYVDKQFSVTELETFAKCPFKYFAERILNLEIIEEPTEEIEALELGSYLHRILFEFYTEIRNKSIKLSNCRDSDFIRAKNMLFKIAAKQLEHDPLNLPAAFYEREKIFGINGDETKSILYKFLETERYNNDNFIPSYFETSFGKIRKSDFDKILSLEEPVTINNIKLRGKIDRVETDELNMKINVADYKLSGKKPSLRELNEGLSLQLPVYLYAVVQLLQAKLNRKFEPEKMIIYSLKYKENEFGKNNVSPTRKRKDINYSKLNGELFNSVFNYISSYVNSISEGMFHLSSHEDRELLICRYCQFKSICRIQEVLK